MLPNNDSAAARDRGRRCWLRPVAPATGRLSRIDPNRRSTPMVSAWETPTSKKASRVGRGGCGALCGDTHYWIVDGIAPDQGHSPAEAALGPRLSSPPGQ